MKNYCSDTAISWLCTGKKAVFKGEGNIVLKCLLDVFKRAHRVKDCHTVPTV